MAKNSKKISPKVTTKKITKTKTVSPLNSLKSFSQFEKVKKMNWSFLSKVLLIIIIGLVLFMLARRYKGLVIAGVVNKTPITKMQLNQMLVKRYGQAVFDEIVSSELIKQEAQKLGVTVAVNEIQDEIKKLEERLGGAEELKTALTQYGLSRTELEDQIKLSILQRKIIESQNKFEISEQEAQEYFKANTASFASKKFDEVKEEIVSLLKDQKMQEAFNTWFTEVKAKAQIESFLD